MLDTHGRNKIERLFDKGSDFFIKMNLTPSNVSVLALITGVSASAVLYFWELKILAVGLLWFSGYLDAVDGNMARKTQKTTALGTLMDIVFDRIVELAVIIAIALKMPQCRLALVFLSCAIVMSMTIFLTTGNLVKNKGRKSFFYQAGLMERTEGFICFSLMMLSLPTDYTVYITYIYALLIYFTAGQRFFMTKKMLDEENQ